MQGSRPPDVQRDQHFKSIARGLRWSRLEFALSGPPGPLRPGLLVRTAEGSRGLQCPTKHVVADFEVEVCGPRASDVERPDTDPVPVTTVAAAEA